jgi:uncharacterized protein (DUF58 family)
MARPVPTGRLALVVTVAALPLAILRADGWWLVGLFLAAIAALAIADLVATVSPADIEVEREFPATLTVGDVAKITWRVTNRSSRATAVTVADAMWPSFNASRRGSTMQLDPLRRHRFGARISPQRRGRFPFGAIAVRTAGPLGLMARQSNRNVPGSIAVMPAYPSRELMATRMRIPLESGIRSVRSRGSGTEFDQLREYRQGDDFRKVDWAATARQQHVVVRDYRAERNQYVIALLDNGRSMAGTVGDTPRVEHAMDAVLGLTQVAGRLGDNVGLLTFDSQVRGIVPARHSKSQFARVAEAMYLLDPALDESAYGVAFNSAAARFRRRSLFVVFTELADTVIADALLPALASLTRTHLVLIAAVRDPDVADWASASGHEFAADAYRSAAAVAALDARDRTAARLRAAGALVVDARPGELATDVVDRYLELKATGRL